MRDLAARIIFTIVCMGLVIAVTFHSSTIRNQQRQIDSICMAMPHAVVWDKTGEVEVATYGTNLPTGSYILCFADYKYNWVVAEYVPPFERTTDATPDPSAEQEVAEREQPKSRYVQIFDVPKQVITGWMWREVRDGPTLLRIREKM